MLRVDTSVPAATGKLDRDLAVRVFFTTHSSRQSIDLDHLATVKLTPRDLTREVLWFDMCRVAGAKQDHDFAVLTHASMGLSRQGINEHRLAKAKRLHYAQSLTGSRPARSTARSTDRSTHRGVDVDG